MASSFHLSIAWRAPPPPHRHTHTHQILSPWLLMSRGCWFFVLSLVNATHTIFKAHSPLMKTVAALSGFLCLGRHFFCHYRHFIIFQGLSPCRPWKTRKKRSECRGGQAVMEHLISCSLWEPLRQRCERICDIESVLITKTGIKGDWTQLSSELFEGFIGKCSFGAGSCLD